MNYSEQTERVHVSMAQLTTHLCARLVYSHSTSQLSLYLCDEPYTLTVIKKSHEEKQTTEWSLTQNINEIDLLLIMLCAPDRVACLTLPLPTPKQSLLQFSIRLCSFCFCHLPSCIIFGCFLFFLNHFFKLTLITKFCQ